MKIIVLVLIACVTLLNSGCFMVDGSPAELVMKATGQDKRQEQMQQDLQKKAEERRQQNLADQQRIYHEEFLASEARQACRANPTPECIAKTGTQPDTSTSK